MTSFFYVISIATCQPLFKPYIIVNLQNDWAVSNYRTFKVLI